MLEWEYMNRIVVVEPNVDQITLGTIDSARWASYGSLVSVIASGRSLAEGLSVAGLSMVMDVRLGRFPSCGNCVRAF